MGGGVEEGKGTGIQKERGNKMRRGRRRGQ